MEYKASQELIDILLKYGFTEDTKSQYPEHHKRWLHLGEYDPNSIKRSFIKGRFRITFDYINICFQYNSPSIFFNTIRIKKNQLVSFLYFSQLPSSKKLYFLKEASNKEIIINIYDNLQEKKKHAGYLRGASLAAFQYHLETIENLKETL